MLQNVRLSYQFTIKSLKQKTLKFYYKYLQTILLNLKKHTFFIYKICGLPTKKKKITVLKSPHVYKKAQEHFQLKKYSLILQIYALPSFLRPLLKYLMLNKPSSINFYIKQNLLESQL